MKRFGRSAVSVLLVVLVAALVARTYTLMADPLFEDSASRDSVDVTVSRAFNALLVGVDNSGQLADAIMLVNVDRELGRISMLSVPRDTRVYYNDRYCKINSCYADGIDALIDEVKKLTGVYINYYAVIAPGTLASVVDALGGVEYTVEQDMHYSDPAQDLYIDLRAGEQTLDGEMAEQYCRYRQYAMGDYQRVQAQQRFFKALFEQKLNIKYIPKLYELYTSLDGKIKTNVSLSDIVSNIDVMQLLSDGEVQCFDPPGHFNDMRKDGISYYIIEDESLNEYRSLCISHFSIK